MNKKSFILLIIILFLLLNFPFNLVLAGNQKKAGESCQQDTECEKNLRCMPDPCSINPTAQKICGRPLEICYPQIGNIRPQVVEVKLPQYIDYIFRFAVAIIGFIILGALVYSGVSYFFSFGNPQKLIDAREGIIAAFVGGIILLAAYLIFNTINPQLTIIEPPKIPSLYGVAVPGVYLCNYDATQVLPDFGYTDLDTLFKDYLANEGGTEDEIKEKQLKATEVLGKLILNPDDRSKQCRRLGASTNLKEAMLPDYTIFAIPRIQVRPRTDNDPPGPPGRKTFNEPIYEYAVIFSKYADHRGPKLLLPLIKREANGRISIYHQFDVGYKFKPGRAMENILEGKAESVFLVQKPFEIISSARVILFSCYNAGTECPPDPENKDKPVENRQFTFTLGGDDYKKVESIELSEKGLLRNTRSIALLPEGQFVVWFGDPYDPEDYENFWILGGRAYNLRDMERCSNSDQDKLKKEDRSNSCAGGLLGVWQFISRSEVCVPCFSHLTIIRGTAL